MKKKVVVIGSGLGGLVAALKLAKNGFEVVVLEKHFQAGGYATNFRRKDAEGNFYNFDVSLHGIGDLNTGRYFNDILKELGVLNNIKLLRKKETATIVYDDGTLFDIPDDYKHYIDVFIQKYPHEEKGLLEIFKYLKKIDDEFEKDVYREKKAPSFFDELSNITLYDFLKQYVKDENLISDFSFLWLYYGLNPNELSAFYYLIPWLGYHIGGTYYFEGGAGNLSNTLVKLIKDNGSDVILGDEVISINATDNKIVSVRTKKGNTYEADYFISNASPMIVRNLLNEGKLKENLYNEIKDKEVGVSLTQLYIGLDTLPQDLGIVKSDYFIHYSKDKNFGYDFIENKDYYNTPMAVVNYNLLDPNLNKDKGFICITIGDLLKNFDYQNKEVYKKQKEEITNILLDRLYKLFPKVKGHIKVLELGTPYTMMRYTNNDQGAVYGYKQDLKNSGFKRLYHQLDDTNLYFASAWSQPGGGYEGAMLSGNQTADLLIKESITKKDNEKFNIDMTPNVFIKGMIDGANINNITKDVSYRFEFSDINKTYDILIKDKKIKLTNLDKVDVVVKCSYDTWYKISFNKLDGEVAFRKGLLKIDGSMDLFMEIPKIFSTTEEKPKKEKKIIKYASFFVFVSLLPWIFLWATEAFIPGYIIGSVSLILSIVIIFTKPKSMRYLRNIDLINIVSFITYLIFSLTSFKEYSFLIGLFLPFGLIASILKENFTQSFSYHMYPNSITKTNLFRKVNIKLSIVWILIFIVQFIFVHVIFTHNYLANLIYLLNIVGILVSIFYPKKIMS